MTIKMTPRSSHVTQKREENHEPCTKSYQLLSRLSILVGGSGRSVAASGSLSLSRRADRVGTLGKSRSSFGGVSLILLIGESGGLWFVTGGDGFRSELLALELTMDAACEATPRVGFSGVWVWRTGLRRTLRVGWVGRARCAGEGSWGRGIEDSRVWLGASRRGREDSREVVEIAAW